MLERQIDYGAKLGHVVLSLAKMELNNFYKNVMPVADYFDQREMLHAVSYTQHVKTIFFIVYTIYRALLRTQSSFNCTYIANTAIFAVSEFNSLGRLTVT